MKINVQQTKPLRYNESGADKDSSEYLVQP